MGALDQSLLPELNKARLDEIDTHVKELTRVIKGDNGEGLRTRVAKLQDRVDLVLKVMWATFGSVLALILATIWDKLM